MNRTKFWTTNNKNKLEQQTTRQGSSENLNNKHVIIRNYTSSQTWDWFLDVFDGGEMLDSLIPVCYLLDFRIYRLVNPNFLFSIVFLGKMETIYKENWKSVKD